MPKTSPDVSRRTFQTAVERWASVGPYFAMFPVDMAFRVVEQYTQPGDRVLDPFAGRGSSIYAAGALGRSGCGIEINPVGWLYSAVKLWPASERAVRRRLESLAPLASKPHPSEKDLPEFFRYAYGSNVLRFLLVARDELRWRDLKVDRTLMAFILIYLHGQRKSSLSNQLRDSKAMAPDYAVRWWRARSMEPPDVDPVELLGRRLSWRYRKGQPRLDGAVLLGDSLEILNSRRRRTALDGSFDFLFTSPPYRGVTNYHYDQWLRLWMLGGPPSPTSTGGRWRGKFEGADDYRHLLRGVFKGAAGRMKPDSVIFVRTDARQFTLDVTVEALREAFPSKAIRDEVSPAPEHTQTVLFGDRSAKPGEVDLVLTPK